MGWNKTYAISLQWLYSGGKECVIEKNLDKANNDLNDIDKKIIKILDEKIRPAVAKDGGDIRFKEFKNGVVKVQLQGSCSGCPSSMTLAMEFKIFFVITCQR